MAVRKRSVTLDEDIVAGIEAAVGDRGFSAWLNEAARARLDREHVLQLLSELDEQFGPVPVEALEAARLAWAKLVADGTAGRSGGAVDLMAALEASAAEARKAAPATTHGGRHAAS